MPIYEYACAACGHRFEEWQKMSDPPVKTCPKCKKKKVEKLISQTAFQLKGGGWYADLYSSSKGGDKGDKGGKGEGKGSEGGGSGKTDGKSTESSGKDAGGKAASSEGKSDSKKKDSAKKSDSRAA